MEEKVAELTAKAADQEEKLQIIAVTGKMNDMDKQKFAAGVDLGRTMELTQSSWDELMRKMDSIRK